jgi:hypothetical protein
MYNQQDSLQAHTYCEATKLSAAGEGFGHLVKLLEPEYAMRLRIYVQQLPESVRLKTIYGRAVSRDIPATKRK